MSERRRRFIVLCPHFAPDIAPTGRVMTHIVEQWAALGHEIHVVTSLPWYREHRVENGWGGKLLRREVTPWGSITRINPFPAKSKSNLVGRAVSFIAFSVIVGACAVVVGRRSASKRIDAVVAMSPPLTLGTVGWIVARLRRTRLIFNVQDVFPDAVVATGAITNSTVIALASWLERFTYRRSHAVVVLSKDLQRNVRAKLSSRYASRIHVIENFVDTQRITPRDRMTAYRAELGIGSEVVVMYAGNVGFSQSLEHLLEFAERSPSVTVLINGDGAALQSLRALAADIANVRFGGYQPEARLAEVLATGDIHVVPLRTGLATVSVPSKTYSILAAGRPVVAAVDAGTEISGLLERAGAGLSVAPDDVEALCAALSSLAVDAPRRERLGANGRTYVERHVTARNVAEAYVRLLSDSLSNS
jgi:colanic acid biosynthesis glycosyl transferase WcaI